MAMLEGASAEERAAPKMDAREQTLIRRIQNGEQEKFYELIKPYERRVYTAALAILRNAADAEEIAQEAFLKAFTHLRQFRAEARFSTWLIQIAVNEARMRRRKDHTEAMEPIGERRDGEGTYPPREAGGWAESPSESLGRDSVRGRPR